jgi:GH25 family lysozyme M1 (1,4-beta-N-acetylmuramidase)
VKERVEYQMISDIALLIRNETQIDAAAEDAQVIDAKAEGDRTQSKTLLETSANVRAGVNLSATNGEIDWEKVKAAGVSFVILRAGYRGVVSGSLIEDAKFAANIQGAQSVGLEVGVSFSSQAHNEVEAVEDASAALHLVAAYDIDFPIFMNLGSVEEVSEAEEFTAAQRTAVVQAFCKTITSSGYRSGVYASKEWLTDKLDVASLSNDSIWLAEYKKVPTYQGYYEIWQHTSEGKVNGISGEVGLNLCYVAYSPPE